MQLSMQMMDKGKECGIYAKGNADSYYCSGKVVT